MTEDKTYFRCPGLPSALTNAAREMLRFFLLGNAVNKIIEDESLFEHILDRYRKSIAAMNHAILLYSVYLILAVVTFLSRGQDTVQLLFINAEIPRTTWLMICPMLFLWFQLHLLYASNWLLLMRGIIREIFFESENPKYFTILETTLEGPIAYIWLTTTYAISFFRRFSRNNAVLTISLGAVLFATLICLSPFIVAVLSIALLFKTGAVLVSCAYLALAILCACMAFWGLQYVMSLGVMEELTNYHSYCEAADAKDKKSQKMQESDISETMKP